jgi:putative endonuclease
LAFYLYFIRSKKDGTLYIGQTNNIQKRLQKHNKGQIKSTKNKAPFDLIYVESYNKRREAMFREWLLKSTSGIEEKRTILNLWGCSSVGRALEWHSRGRRFDPDQLHHLKD